MCGWVSEQSCSSLTCAVRHCCTSLNNSMTRLSDSSSLQQACTSTANSCNHKQYVHTQQHVRPPSSKQVTSTRLLHHTTALHSHQSQRQAPWPPDIPVSVCELEGVTVRKKHSPQAVQYTSQSLALTTSASVCSCQYVISTSIRASMLTRFSFSRARPRPANAAAAALTAPPASPSPRVVRPAMAFTCDTKRARRSARR